VSGLGADRLLEAHRHAEAHGHLGELKALPVASALGTMDRHRHDGRAALQGQAADTRPGPLGDLLVT